MIHQEEEAAVVAVEEPVAAAGSSSVAPAGTDQLDLEAAEQLIQLSGGADDDGGSESRSADSVNKRSRGKKDKEAAVESRRRSRADAEAGRSSVASAGKKDDSDGGEPGGKGAEMSLPCSMAAGVEEKDKKKAAAAVESPRRSADRPRLAGKDRDGGILHGEERKRPKFRSLAAIYRETETTRRVTPPASGGEGGGGDQDPAEGERRRRGNKMKRAAEVIPHHWTMDMHVN